MAGLPRTLSLVLPLALATPLGRAEPADPDPATSPKRERALSPRLASAISETLPKYDPAKALAPNVPPALPADQPQNSIIRLPDYIVRERRLPSPEDMLTRKGWEEDAANRYLGPREGLDRTLNSVTLTDLWKRIPVLGRVPFVPFNSLSNGERAQRIYERVERKRRWAELLDLGTPSPVKEKPAVPAKKP